MERFATWTLLACSSSVLRTLCTKTGFEHSRVPARLLARSRGLTPDLRTADVLRALTPGGAMSLLSDRAPARASILVTSRTGLPSASVGFGHPQEWNGLASDSQPTRPREFGAEHRVRTGDLRLGNEAARHSRFFRSVHESPRHCDFVRLPGHRSPPRFHESSGGFSIFICPACATPPVAGTRGIARCDPGFGAPWLLDSARLRPL
jgi:hypothetical protein